MEQIKPLEMERRFVTLKATEFRMETEGNAVVVTGYPARYNALSEELPLESGGTFREMIMPGAFTRTLGMKPDARLLINHEGLPLARTVSGTMTLKEDENGLQFRAVLDPANPRVQEAQSCLKRGDVAEMSFAFRCDDDNWKVDGNQIIREVRAADLHDGDCSIVTYPAYKQTSVGLRGAVDSYKEFRSKQTVTPAPTGMSLDLALKIQSQD